MVLDPVAMGKKMVEAMPIAWEQLHVGQTWPGADTNEAEVLFRAVSIGLLKYLKEHQNDAIQKITQVFPPTVSGNERTFTVTHLDINTNP